MKKTAQVVCTGLFLLILFGVSVMTLWGARGGGTSFYEQRTLAEFPSVSGEGLWSGSYFSQVETALMEHLYQRERLLKLHTLLQLHAARPVVNDLVVNRDKLLSYYTHTYWDTSYLKKDAADMADQLAALNRAVAAYGGYFCYLGFPQQSTYFANHYPDYMESRLWHTTEIRENFAAAMEARALPFVNLYQVYQSLGMPESFYPETDHHCTMEGAFAAYQALMTRIRQDTNLELPVLTREALNFVTLPNSYLGSSARKLYGLWETRDHVTLAELKTPIPFQRWDNGTETDAPLYQRPATDSETLTYEVYMGGDQGETILRTDRPELPNALIIGDSFTNIMEPLLFAGFNETRSLDFRHYREKTLAEYIAEYQPDVVICIRDESVYLDHSGNGALGYDPAS